MPTTETVRTDYRRWKNEKKKSISRKKTTPPALHKNKLETHNYVKVYIFWEGHKILKNLHCRFDRGDFAKILCPSHKTSTLLFVSLLLLLLSYLCKFKCKSLKKHEWEMCNFTTHIVILNIEESNLEIIPQSPPTPPMKKCPP